MTVLREPVSFIIPAYNCAGTIRETLASVFDGNFVSGDEIILIDDCSTDRTPSILKEMQESSSSIRVLRHNHRRGTAAASRNTGIELASSDLLFCLDSDNILARGSLSALCAHLRAAEADAAAFGEIHYFRKDPDQVTHRWIFKDMITLADALAGGFWPGPSGNYLFTRESWIRAGRYHEPSLENLTLDSWTFGIRQLATGSMFVTLPGTWYSHRYGHESHYAQNWRRGNQSLAALIGLIPFLGLLDDQDVDYIFSPEGRDCWYGKLGEHPLKVKSGTQGVGGRIDFRLSTRESNENGLRPL